MPKINSTRDTLRLCKLTKWNNTYGFKLDESKTPPFTVSSVDPNGSAAAAKLKVNDVILQVNKDDMVKAKHADLIAALKKPTDAKKPLELLVMEKTHYDAITKSKGKINRNEYTTFVAPVTMPADNQTQPGLGPGQGIGALPGGNPLGPAGLGAPPTGSNRRVLRLRHAPNVGYDFEVDSSGHGDFRHRITKVTRGSPAENEGLQVNDYIISVNDTRVTGMSGDEFKQFLQTTGRQAEAREDPLVLGVLASSSSRPGRSPSPTGSSRYPPGETSPTRPLTTDRYPALRQCTIRALPGQNSPGFNVTQSSDAYRGANGFQIEGLQSSSPAKSANVRNRDYIIEVDDRNVESDDLWDIRDAITDAYRKRRQVKLLVIDEAGYRWYKERRIRIDPQSADARVTKHATADSSRSPGRGGSSSDEERVGVNPPRRPPKDSISGFGGTDTTKPGLHTPHGDDGKTSTSQQGTKQPPEQTGSSATHGTGPAHGTQHAGTSSTISGSRNQLSRGAVDVISTTEFLRSYHIKDLSGEGLGIEVGLVQGKHTITKVKSNSPASRAGLQINDHIVEVDNENVEWKSHDQVMEKLRAAVSKGSVRLSVVPRTVRVSLKPSEKSQAPDGSKTQNGAPAQNQPDDSSHLTFEPTAPFPRKCVLKRDPKFNGCGFHLSERPPYDTPIIVEVAPDSPAKRSGLSEGDHIIYVDSENVQHIGSFKKIMEKIKHHFQNSGQVELVTVTGPAFQVFKKRGGYLDDNLFDYQSPKDNPMQPRLCKLKFVSHEQDYGLTFRRQNMLLIKDVQSGSSAYALGIKAGEIVLELNGENARYMSMDQVKDIIETSKQQGALKILVIDKEGYRYSIEHAIPLNSLLPFVKSPEKQKNKSGDPALEEPVYI